MARRTVQDGNKLKTVKPNDELQKGETVEGYLVRFDESKEFAGTYSLIMRDAEGKNFRVASHGNIAFAIKDGDLVIGQYTFITKLGMEKKKNGKTTGVYQVDQDDEMTIDVAGAGTTFTSDPSEALLDAASIDPSSLPTNGSSNRNAGNGVSKADLERNAIKARAAKLTQSATGTKN